MMSTDSERKIKPVINITEKERLISGISGGLLLALGIFGFGKSSFRRAIRMTAGSLLIMRGVTGYCPVTAIQDEKKDPDRENDISVTP
jgi:uncharacterized membrane protein